MFSFLLIIFLFQNTISDYVTFPLQKIKKKPINANIKSYIYSELFDLVYYITLNISDKNIPIECSINSTSKTLLINETLNKYDMKSSPTYKAYSELSTSSDIFLLKINDINETLSINSTRLNFSIMNKDNTYCEIGLGRQSYGDDKTKNLITQMDPNNITKSYIFSINYNKNYFRIGDLPELNHPEKYKTEDFNYTYSTNVVGRDTFQLSFFKLFIISKNSDVIKEIMSTG